MELAITDTLAFTMADDGLGIVDDATVAVDDGELVYVGPTAGFDGDPDRLLDGSGTLTLPGLVDVHAHTGLTLARGAAQDVPEIEWMNLALGPLSEAMTPDDRIAGARLGVLESVRSGVTTLGEYAEGVGARIEADRGGPPPARDPGRRHGAHKRRRRGPGRPRARRAVSALGGRGLR